jgi:hypothetical protein
MFRWEGGWMIEFRDPVEAEIFIFQTGHEAHSLPYTNSMQGLRPGSKADEV